MSESKLKVFVKQIHNSVVYSVLYQDESIIRKCGGDKMRFMCSSGVSIESSYMPFISAKGSVFRKTVVGLEVLLRGSDKKMSKDVRVTEFLSEDEAKKAVELILGSLKCWSNNGYFDGGKACEECRSDKFEISEEGVYEF